MTASAVFFIAQNCIENHTKVARSCNRDSGVFLRQSSQKGGDSVRDFVARLIKCGIPRMTAVCICNYFKRRHQIDELKHYIDAVERECNDDLDAL
jgi:hypothetical protein